MENERIEKIAQELKNELSNGFDLTPEIESDIETVILDTKEQLRKGIPTYIYCCPENGTIALEHPDFIPDEDAGLYEPLSDEIQEVLIGWDN